MQCWAFFTFACSLEGSSPEQRQMKETKPKTDEKKVDQNVYKNEKYNFIVKLPDSWKEKYSVEEGKSIPKAEATIDFRYIDGKTDIFTIIVLNMTKAEWEQKGYSDGLWGYITTKNGKTFAYAISGEPRPEYLDQEGRLKPEYEELAKMINQDVMKIVNLIEFK